MQDLWYRYNSLPLVFRISIPIALIFVLVSCSVIAFSGLGTAGNSSTSSQARSSSSPTGEALPEISPLLFGTNLSLSEDKDQVLSSKSTQDLLQKMHIQAMRIPIQKEYSEAAFTRSAQIVEELSAIPIVDLYGPSYSKRQEHNANIVKTAQKVFGKSIVYYEYGNEEDLFTISAKDYTAAWNKDVPQLKKLAPKAHFIGPVTYRFDAAYLQSFLEGANPHPDEVSWHEYTCESAESSEVCMQRISDWSKHIADARAIMSKTVGKKLPIIISEWNYAANAQADDGKYSDAKFMTDWTSQALQTLASNQIFASMQYSCTSKTPLISKDKLTPQGNVFKDLYEHYATNNKIVAMPTVQETPISRPTPTPTPTRSVPTRESLPTAYAPPPTPIPTRSVPTPTPTKSVPTPTPTPQPPLITRSMTPQQVYQAATSGPLLYSSSLSHQDAASWSITNFSGGGSCQFANGGYQANMPQRDYFASCMANALDLGNVTIQVEMKITSGSNNDGGGIIFRDTGAGNYRFRINLDGSWDFVPTGSSGSSAAIKKGLNQINKLTIVAQGPDIYIFVNQQYLTRITSTSYASGRIGLMAVCWNSNTTIVFRNMNVWRLR